MKIVLFGAGDRTQKFMAKEKFLSYDVQAVADNDKKKWGMEIGQGERKVKVISADEIVNYNFDIVLITIAHLGYQIDIMMQLMALGISADKIKILRAWEIRNCLNILPATDDYAARDALFFDTSVITRDNNKTGIQRVIRELYKNMIELGAKICPMQCVCGRWISSREFICRIDNKSFDDNEYLLDIKGKRLFLPDAAWNIPDFFDSIQDYSDSCFVVYDLIPILYPETFSAKLREDFTRWLERALQMNSKCICISQAVADDLQAYYRRKGFQREKPLEVYVMHLGFDIPKLRIAVRDEIKDFVKKAKTFLMVGTVEPRKNHLLLLQSMKQVLETIPNEEVQLLIIGRDGWMNEEFKRMYETDDTIRNHVLWIKDGEDCEIQWAYQNCAALVYPPRTEGFGLPLVEAAHFHLPIMCSDIPVFREVVGNHADYFRVDDVDSLSRTIIRWLSVKQHPDSGQVKKYTWRECAEEVLDILDGKRAPYRLLQ